MNRALIISANFYREISKNLKNCATDYLKNQGFTWKIIDVPGIFEIPAVLSFFAKRKSFDLYIFLGCVIRGETSHYDNITQEVFRAITNLVIEHELASGIGIVTTENYEQAVLRSTGVEKNSGLNAVRAALSIMKIYRENPKGV
ncbi:MAG: 6,7-dimethyl-8-ribityllumazine synthase [Rickettsiaceae bacterium H1]|nr:6,7-dimethyl-8-ribityllumazine synthase [Rickettsiaceae bacterium H1]